MDAAIFLGILFGIICTILIAEIAYLYREVRRLRRIVRELEGVREYDRHSHEDAGGDG
jgi:hypothetical protein